MLRYEVRMLISRKKRTEMSSWGTSSQRKLTVLRTFDTQRILKAGHFLPRPRALSTALENPMDVFYSHPRSYRRTYRLNVSVKIPDHNLRASRRSRRGKLSKPQHLDGAEASGLYCPLYTYGTGLLERVGTGIVGTIGYVVLPTGVSTDVSRDIV